MEGKEDRNDLQGPMSFGYKSVISAVYSLSSTLAEDCNSPVLEVPSAMATSFDRNFAVATCSEV